MLDVLTCVFDIRIPVDFEVYLKLFQKYVMVSLKKFKIFKFFYYIKKAKHSKGGGRGVEGT